VAILFALGLLAATGLTHFFKRSITKPLKSLTDLAKEVSNSKNYSLRLTADSRDELGVLVNSFNKMMEEVALRDRALESNKANLELEVVQRTAEYKRAKDEAIDANRAKSQFLANMSHEIRTPLNGILGMTELASEIAESPEQREYLTIVQQSSLSLLAIINDILDFSKIEAGKLELTPVQFDLRRTVDRVLALMAVQAEAKGLTLEAEVLDCISADFVADEGRIRQVLVNLVGNAIKFTPSGGKVVIRLHGVKVNSEFEKVIFEVIDSGIGISAEKHQQIFEAFAQADGSISRKFGGSGLGLSICRMILELMGGKISVSSKLGEGAKFSFELPLKIAPPKALAAEPQSLEPALSGVNVLLVEDNQVNQKIVQKLLGKRGVLVTTANNGAEALIAWREGTFDLILMDCQMPVMSGYDSTKSIRREELAAGKVRVPIIALTAQALSGDREECLAAGMDGYVSKPINSKKLFDEISRFLDKN
jgi:signal transduction histidine kinase/ActR/RegA family two-component response regulator